MTTAKEYGTVHLLNLRDDANGFCVAYDTQYISICKKDGHWSELTSGPIKQFVTADEAVAWIEGVAWCKFIERTLKK